MHVDDQWIAKLHAIIEECRFETFEECQSFVDRFFPDDEPFIAELIFRVAQQVRQRKGNPIQ